MKVMF
jgi:exonuclease III